MNAGKLLLKMDKITIEIVQDFSRERLI